MGLQTQIHVNSYKFNSKTMMSEGIVRAIMQLTSLNRKMPHLGVKPHSMGTILGCSM